MMDSPTQQTPTPTPARKQQDWGQIGIWAAMAAVAILILWLAFALRAANLRTDEAVAKQKQEDSVVLKQAQKMGVVRGATATAAAVLPLLDLRSKQQFIDDEALMRVCADMVSGNKFEFVAITDTSGKVIAASDLRYKDKSFPIGRPEESEQNGVWQVSRPVARAGIVFGAVIVRAK